MRKRRNKYEMWRDKKLPKDIQRQVDSFAGAPLDADGYERAFRAGWAAYALTHPIWEKENVK